MPGTPFPENIGVKVPEIDIAALPHDQGSLDDMDDYGDTFEPEDPSVLAGFFDLDKVSRTIINSGNGGDAL